MEIRSMKITDLKQVAEIEKVCFPRPWSEEALYEDLKHNDNSGFLVAVRDNFILGHIGLWDQTDHVHVTTLGVRPEYRRQGIGTQLIRTVIQDCNDMDLTLEVRKSNNTARDFYRELGFTEVGRRPHYYSDNGEDALVMSYRKSKRNEVLSDGRSR